MMHYDVIVIGGGHNSLTAAALLAKAGRRVLLCEKRAALGGLAAGEEFHPGYRSPGVLHDTGWVRPGVLDALGAGAGVRVRTEPPALYVPSAGGRGVLLGAALADELVKSAPEDVEGYRQLRALLDRVRKPLARLFDRPAPDAANLESWVTQADVGWTAMGIRRLGRTTMLELMRAAPMALRDLLDDYLKSPLLQAALAGPALLPCWSGPWSPHTAAMFMFSEAVASPGLVGGPAKLTAALEEACKRFGAQCRLSAAVRSVLVRDGRAYGVELTDGEKIEARAVASGLDPRTTLLSLVTPTEVPVRVADQMRAWRMRGIVAKLDVALAAPIRWNGRPDLRPVRVQIGDSLLALERAFEPTKYGQAATEFHMDVCVPTAEDPSFAPAGAEVLSVLVRGVPYSKMTDAERGQIVERALAQLERHAQGLRKSVVGHRFRTPGDLEAEFGVKGGHLFHGEYALDQLLCFRPTAEIARHRTPVEGLFLVGGGCHPGGGISCAPGAGGARAVRAFL